MNQAEGEKLNKTKKQNYNDLATLSSRQN